MSNTPKFELPVAGGVATKRDLERGVNKALDQVWGAISTGLVDPVEGEDLIDRIAELVGEGHDYRAAAELARTEAQAARIEAENAKVAAENALAGVVTAGAWTYMPATVAAMNAITGMANNNTALVLETMEGYRYNGTSWQPLNIVLGNVNKLKEEMQRVWSVNAGVLRRLTFERICTTAGKRLPQTMAESSSPLQDFTNGFVSGLIPVTKGQCFRITYRNIADATATQGRVKVIMAEANGAPVGIMVESGVTHAYTADAALNRFVAGLDRERAEYEYFRVPQDGFIRVSCQTPQREHGFLDEITEDMWIEGHITNDKALLRRALRDPSAVVCPLRDFNLNAIIPTLATIPAGAKYLSGIFGGYVSDIRTRGVRVSRAGAVRVSNASGFMPAGILAVIDANASLGAQQYYNLPVEGGDTLELLYTLTTGRNAAGNATFFIAHADPVTPLLDGSQSIAEGYPLSVANASLAVRRATIDGREVAIPHLQNSTTGTIFSTSPFPARKGEVLRLEYAVDATQTGYRGAVYTAHPSVGAALAQAMATGTGNVSEMLTIRPIPLEHPALRTLSGGVTHNKAVVFMPMDDDGWLVMVSNALAHFRVQKVTPEEAISEVTARWRDRPIDPANRQVNPLATGYWGTVNGHNYSTLGIFPVFKGYILAAKTNTFTGQNMIVRSVGFGESGPLPTLGITPAASDAFSARFYTQAEPGYENIVPPDTGLGAIGADGNPHYFLGDVNGYMAINHQLHNEENFQLDQVTVEYIKQDDFFARDGWRELTPTGNYSDVSGWFPSHGEVYQVGRTFNASLGGVAGFVPHIPMRKGDIIHVRHNSGRGTGTSGGFYFWDRATKTRKVELTGKNKYPVNTIYHPGEYFYIAPEDGTLVLGWAGKGAPDAAGLRPWGMLRTKPSYRFIDRAEYDANMGLVTTREVHIPADGELVVNFVNTALPSNASWADDKRRDGFAQFIHNGKLLFTAILETAIQGQSSALDRKTNYDIKLFNAKKERIMIQVGDWLPTNKLVLKGYMLDQTNVRDPLCVNWYAAMRATRPYPRNLHVDPAVTTLLDTFPQAKRAGQMAASSRGRPVLFSLGGQILGQWTLREKKDAPNYGIQEGNPDHIWMQSDYQAANGIAGSGVDWSDFKWSAWECAHPEMPSHIPPEDPVVLGKIERFFNWTKAVSNGTANFTATHAGYINLDLWIDYFILMDVAGGWDNWTNNVILSCLDGERWNIHPYDMNMCLGFSRFDQINTAGNIPLTSGGFISAVRSYTGPGNIRSRWSDLRDSGVISEAGFNELLFKYAGGLSDRAMAMDRIYHHVPMTTALEDIDKFKVLTDFVKNRIAFIDGLYSYTPGT